MPDIAVLGIRVDNRGLPEGVRGLDDLTRAGAKAEQQTQELTRATTQQSAAQRQSSDMFLQARRSAEESRVRIQALREETLRNNSALAAHAAATQQAGAASRGAGVGINAFREPLTSLTAQLAGANPAVARLTSLVGSFAVGSGMMVGALAGLSAIGALWQKITEDAREAREAQLGALDDLSRSAAAQRLTEAGPGAAERQKIAAGRSEMERIRGQLGAIPTSIEAVGVSADEQLAAGMARGFYEGRRRDLLDQYGKLMSDVWAEERKLKQAMADAAARPTAAGPSGPKLSFELGDIQPLYQLNPLTGRPVSGGIGGSINDARAGLEAIDARQDAVAKAAATQLRFNAILERQNASLATARQRIEAERQAAIAATKTQEDLAAARAENNKQIAIQAGLQIGGMVSSHLTSSGHSNAGAAVGVATSAAAGFAAGGPFGAAAGLVVGLTSAFLDHNRAAKEAAEAEKALAEQRRQQANDTLKATFYGNQDLESRKAFAEAEVLRNQGKEKEAAAAKREAERKAMEARFQRELVEETTRGGFNLEALLAAQAAERLAFETTKAADAMRGLAGDLNGPQGIRKSLAIYRASGDRNLWGPPGNPGNGGFPGGVPGGGTPTATTVVNNYIQIDGLTVPIGAGQTPGQVLDMVVSERNRRTRNGSPDPLQIAVVR